MKQSPTPSTKEDKQPSGSTLSATEISNEVTLESVAAVLSRYRIAYSSERIIAEGISSILQKHSIPFQMEYALDGRSRLDFLVGGHLALEIKVDGSNASVYRQLHRYAGYDAISGILLYTTRSRHLNGLPSSFRGKPIKTVVLRSF